MITFNEFFYSGLSDDAIMNLFKCIFISSLVLSFAIVIPNAFAQEIPDEPKKYPVGISLKSVGEIDKSTGSYDLNFWYFISSDEINLEENPPPPVEFLNGKKLEYTSQVLQEDRFETRVQGFFAGPMDFHDFPFEKIHLRVEIEPLTPFTTDYVIFTVDETSGVDETANIPGWIISNPTFTVEDNTYDESETFSRYTADFTVERSSFGSFLKILLPVFIVVGISFVAYMIPEHYDIVAILALLPLVAVVFLHVNTLNELPPLGYLSIFDKIMIISYALIANNSLSTARRIKVYWKSSEEFAWKINILHLKLSPVIIAVLGIVLFVLMV